MLLNGSVNIILTLFNQYVMLSKNIYPDRYLVEVVEKSSISSIAVLYEQNST